ncbi:MAG TPA: nucleotidyltransferase domain-containing protein [Thermomicrobiales bacterium]|nr:nucleotidyltransferase domain-containing protein [Thermomicrobiales bacterium]
MQKQPPLHPAIERFTADAMAEPSVRAVYVFGSVAEGTSIASSDIDLFVVVRGDLDADAARLREIAGGVEGPPLDLVVLSEGELRRDGHFRLERASRLISGDDIRPELPPTTLDTFIRRYSEAPLAYMSILRAGRSIAAPLYYPDPSGSYFGYDSRALPPAGVSTHNIKGLVALICWISTLRLVREKSIMAASKSESVSAYAAEISDGWTSYVEDIYRLGHDRWHYLVPDDSSDQELLRDLCERTLSFENDYLARYGTAPTA